MTDIRLPPGVAVVPEVPCPYCAKPLNATADQSGSGRGPKPGDFTVCAHCFGICVFTPAMTLRAMGMLEFAVLDEEVQTAMNDAVEHLRRYHLKLRSERRH